MCKVQTMTSAGEAITVRELILEDISKFSNWGHHDDLRFLHYDFPVLNLEEQREWYRSKKNLWRWIYVAENTLGEPVGYMTVKNIQHILRRAELGIVFDPGQLSCGYGSAALKAFLGIYFYKRQMRSLWLRVAEFNPRAQRVYEKVGFVKHKTTREAFEEQGRNFELLLKYPENFEMDGDILMTTFHRMKITRKRFETLYTK